MTFCAAAAAAAAACICCRYSGFLVLYPIGVSSELTMAWLALPFVKKTGVYFYFLDGREGQVLRDEKGGMSAVYFKARGWGACS
jgi:hypothetical protein